jgi:hypothetical protein
MLIPDKALYTNGKLTMPDWAFYQNSGIHASTHVPVQVHATWPNPC